MRKIAAFVLCLVMICSCGFAQCFADEAGQTETAVLIIPEAPLCLDFATMNQVIEVLDNTGDYVKVKSPNGVEGYAEARWLNIFPVSGTAQVRPTRVEIFAEMLKQGDTVEVIERGDEFTEVKANGVEGKVETRFLRFEDGEDYQTWTCHTAPETWVFNNPWLRDKGGKIEFNSDMNTYSDTNATWVKMGTEFTVLDDLGDCYYVKNDSLEGFIIKGLALADEPDYTLRPSS